MPRLLQASRIRPTVALCTVGLALLGTSQSPFLNSRTPFALFFAAVLVSARLGGTNTALLTSLLSAVVTDFFIVPPLYSFRLSSLNFVEETVFLSVSMLIVYLTASRERSERSLRDSEERHRVIANSANDAIVTIDENSTILFVNTGATKIFGYSQAEMLGAKLTMLMPEYLRHLHENGIKRYLTTRQAHLNWDAIDVEGLHKNGKLIPLELSFGEFFQEGRSRFTGVIRDVTERKKQQEERDRFFALGADILVIASFDGHFKWVNPACERTLGWTTDELTSQPWLSFVHPDDREKTIVETASLLQGNETVAFENRYLHKDESYRSLLWKAKPYPEERLIFCVASDITERKLLEEQLRLSQKLESVGKLAGGVAHDFNNLLTVITGYGELALNRVTETAAVSRSLEEIVKAAERATSLTRQLLAFSRKQVLQPRIVDLSETLSDMDNMLQRLIGEDITLLTLLDPGLGKVLVDPGQIEQVVMNLAVNARDAMPFGGKLTIETNNVVLDEAYALHHVSVIPGPYVMLAISDTGMGMDDETMGHIFEPFFTTKEVGKGTGLGLAMVYGIVKQSGGYIWVYSEPEHGTSFKIYLPLVPDDDITSSETGSVAPKVLAHETVLLVEDETSVRELLVKVLEGEGYKVLAAANGREALDICQHYEDSIDLLLTDVVMPGMSGRQLVERLTGRCRNLKVLYMSGYTDDAIVHHGVLDSDVAFLQKPFTPEGVALKVREVLLHE